MLIKGDIIPPNHAKATKLIEEKFKTNEPIHFFLLGNSLAMAYYGCMLQQGRGVDVNYQEAIEFFKKGLNNYEPKAMTYYGLHFKKDLELK